MLPSSQKDSGPVPQNTKPSILTASVSHPSDASSSSIDYITSSTAHVVDSMPMGQSPAKAPRFSAPTNTDATAQSLDLRLRQQNRMPMTTSSMCESAHQSLDTHISTNAKVPDESIMPTMYQTDPYPKFTQNAPLSSSSQYYSATVPNGVYPLSNVIAKHAMSSASSSSTFGSPYPSTVPPPAMPVHDLYATTAQLYESHPTMVSTIPNCPQPIYATSLMTHTAPSLTHTVPSLTASLTHTVPSLTLATASYANYTCASMEESYHYPSSTSSHHNYNNIQHQQQQQQARLPAEPRTVPNYMVTATGDMVIPSYAERPPLLNGCTYTDTLFPAAGITSAKQHSTLKTGAEANSQHRFNDSYAMNTTYT